MLVPHFREHAQAFAQSDRQAGTFCTSAWCRLFRQVGVDSANIARDPKARLGSVHSGRRRRLRRRRRRRGAVAAVTIAVVAPTTKQQYH